MKERLRIFGVIVDDTKKAPTKENLKGYVILDTKTYQLKFLTEDQTKMMLGSYVFSNAEIGKKGDVVNTECAMSRVVPYTAQTKRPARQGVTILGQVDGKSRYRVITQDGKVTTLDEGKLIELIKKEKISMGTYYRGRNKGDTRRISTGVKEWDENLFCTMELRYARIYGKDIMKIEVKDTARVLREGSREFKDRIGVIREGQTLIEWGVYVLRKAREQGVDIVEFERQGDVGTVILNREVIKRATEI